MYRIYMYDTTHAVPVCDELFRLHRLGTASGTIVPIRLSLKLLVRLMYVSSLFVFFTCPCVLTKRVMPWMFMLIYIYHSLANK